jgi:RHH-type transcriptional regulator, rel operon repressor / antitoxin RelB
VSNSFTIDLNDEGLERLKAAAAHVGKSPLDFVREAVQEHIEDVEDVMNAEAALTKIRSGEVKTCQLEELMREFGPEN